MKLNKIQREMIQWRLDATDAVAEVLEETLDYTLTFDECMKHAWDAEENLLAKLIEGVELTPIEIHIVGDVRGCCDQYAGMAEDDIGFETTPQMAGMIAKAMDELDDLLAEIYPGDC